MSLLKVQDALARLFERERIIFWYDEEQQFSDGLSEISLSGVNTINLNEIGQFETKVIVEIERSEDRFLIYSSTPCPAPESNILYDIFLYSYSFSADQPAIYRDELGLTNPSIREFIRSKINFFQSQKRRDALKRLIHPEDDEKELALKMLQVVTGASNHSLSHLLLKLYEQAAIEETFSPEIWREVERYSLADDLWSLSKEELGYPKEDREASLENLLLYLTCSDLYAALLYDLPRSLIPFVLQPQHKANNAVVFMSDWRDKEQFRSAYNWCVNHAQEELGVANVLEDIPLNSLAEACTFNCIEEALLRSTRSIVVDGTTRDLDSALRTIESRKNSFWLKLEGRNYSSLYEALRAASYLIAHRASFGDSLAPTKVKSFWDSYTSSLYKFDQYFRQYYQCRTAPGAGEWLESITEVVDEIYLNWFLPQLVTQWGTVLGSGLLDNWQIDGVPNQYKFFSHFVAPILKDGQKKRVAVIVSDALRYEAAKELCHLVNRRNNFESTIESQLGVLPSYTKLGMASLLPHKTLEITQSEQVTVDGLNTAGLQGRAEVLARYDGIALAAKELTSATRDELRQQIGDKLLVYIYHDRIDETGDSIKSESQTFKAVEETIDELDRLISSVMNNLNTSVVFVTTDHGFMFFPDGPSPEEKLPYKHLSGSVLKEHQRFVLGSNLDATGAFWRTSSKTTAKSDTPWEIMLARGYSRFHLQGGAKYFHGGAMPQEICLPVITCKKFRDKAAEKVKTKKVDISLLLSDLRITSNRQRIRFIQNESVSDKVLPRTVRFVFVDGEEPISDQPIVTFNASSENPVDREQFVSFAFRNKSYDGTKTYYLKLLDEANGVEFARYNFKIRILVGNEFDGF